MDNLDKCESKVIFSETLHAESRADFPQGLRGKSLRSGSFNYSKAQRPSQAAQIWSPQRGLVAQETMWEGGRTRQGHAVSASN